MLTLKLVLVFLFAVNAVVATFQVGKEREPITPGLAAMTTLINGALIYWILSVMS